ncbi:UNVERIFIED_CONTAM: hypothetical protein K2H54_060771 [Gekko kuhli]
MAAAAPGITIFNPTHPELWEAWVEQPKHFFQTQGTEDAAKKEAWLLGTCEVSTNRLVQSLIMPVTLEATTYVELHD